MWGHPTSKYITIAAVILGIMVFNKLFFSEDSQHNPNKDLQIEYDNFRERILNICTGHKKPNLCQRDLKIFSSYQEDKLIAFELRLIDISDIKHGEGYGRKNFLKQLNSVNSIVYKGVEDPIEFKEFQSICIGNSPERFAKSGLFFNLRFFADEEYKNFVERFGDTPKWKISGQIILDAERNDATLYSLDGCNLPAEFPNITMSDFRTLKFCSQWERCSGDFWVTINFNSNKPLSFVSPIVVIKAFKLNFMTMDNILKKSVEKQLHRSIKIFKRYEELTRILSK